MGDCSWHQLAAACIIMPHFVCVCVVCVRCKKWMHTGKIMSASADLAISILTAMRTWNLTSHLVFLSVEKTAQSVISQLMALSASWDSKQLQHLLEMEQQEEQQLLNVAQAKYQSYQRKDVISKCHTILWNSRSLFSNAGCTWFVSICLTKPAALNNVVVCTRKQNLHSITPYYIHLIQI
jgi:hypothetical protein